LRAFLLQQWWLVVVVLGSLTPLAVQFVSRGFLPTLRTLDRRWVFLLMFWSVLVPIYFVGVTGRTFPEIPSALAVATFDEIEHLQAGDPVLLSFDYDPASEGELGPMATAFVKHPRDAGAYARLAEGAGLPVAPVAMVADVCRPELLFELDATAVVPLCTGDSGARGAA